MVSVPGRLKIVATELRTDEHDRTVCCEVCHTKLGVGTDAYVLRREIIGPGVTQTIKGTWLCSRACAMTHLRFDRG